MLPGEVPDRPVCCGVVLPWQVCNSCGGTRWFIGSFCPNCGPHSRASNYFDTKKEAEDALRADPTGITWERR